jgi:hypothetical protein
VSLGHGSSLLDSRRMQSFVPADRLYAMLDEALAEYDRLGLSPVRRGLYALPQSADITSILRLESWKGGTYSLSWGVSLAYVPNKLASKLVFHRTFKSSRFDLWEDGRSVAEREGCDWREFLVSVLDGERQARQDLSRAVAWTHPRAQAWWREAATLEGVLGLASVQVRRRPHVIDDLHWPRPHLVMILTLACLGRREEAGKELARFAARFHTDEIEAIERAIAVVSRPQ